MSEFFLELLAKKSSSLQKMREKTFENFNDFLKEENINLYGKVILFQHQIDY